MLVNVSVSGLIRERLAEKQMSADEVLVRLSVQARGTMADFIQIGPTGNWNFDFVAAEEAGKLPLIKKLKETKDGTALELYDAQAALVHIGKAHGLFIERTQVEGTITTAAVTPEQLQEARRTMIEWEINRFGSSSDKA